MNNIIELSPLNKYKRVLRFLFVIAIIFSGLSFNVLGIDAFATGTGISIDVNTDATEDSMAALELLFVLSIIALAPSLLIMMTSFTRIIIVFSFLRNALGLQQTPPTQVLVGIALFLTLFIMQPTFEEINEVAIAPYQEGELTVEEVLVEIQEPLKVFMLKETKVEDLNLFLSVSGQGETLEEVDVESLTSLGLEVIVPSFITSELKTAFTIGFMLFLPFLVIDMIVASTLMSMGMVMLPPSMISLPFKVMIFVVVDGWSLIMETLIQGFF